mgnify:CR=1 FL=1
MDKCPVQGGLGMNEQSFHLFHAGETGISSCSVAFSFSFAKLLYLRRGNFSLDLSTGDPKMRGVIIINKTTSTKILTYRDSSTKQPLEIIGGAITVV